MDYEEIRKHPSAVWTGPVPEDWPLDVLRTDESGEVDLEQIEFNLSLTPGERMEQHYRWRLSVERLRDIAREAHGSAFDDGEVAG